jgi:hypothetical protein
LGVDRSRGFLCNQLQWFGPCMAGALLNASNAIGMPLPTVRRCNSQLVQVVRELTQRNVASLFGVLDHFAQLGGSLVGPHCPSFAAVIGAYKYCSPFCKVNPNCLQLSKIADFNIVDRHPYFLRQFFLD